MKLSEAIRVGAKLGKQCFYAYTWKKGMDRRTCAIGAAAAAAGIKVRSPGQFEAAFPVSTLIGPFVCPAGLPCRRSPKYLRDIIVHLNDIHRWPREQIADWVATIEPQLEAVHAE